MQRSGDLSDSEKKFLEARSPIVMDAMRRILGEKGPKSIEETPRVALAISGGGYRAVSTSCGAMEALMEKNLFDALMYCVGLSGSVWYLSATYSRKSFSSLRQLKEDHDWLRGQLGKDLNFSPKTAFKHIAKKLLGNSSILTQRYGLALADVLLADEHKNNKMSSLREYVEDGKVPLPIFSLAHVKNHYPATDFWEEIELTPFDATYASYRLLLSIEDLNSIWENGTLIEKREEPPLHYVMGCCGNAYAILPYHIKDGGETEERSFVDMVKGGVKGAIRHVKSKLFGFFGFSDAEGISAPPADGIRLPAISKEEFKADIYEAILALAPQEEDLPSAEDAYKLYLQYVNNGDEDFYTAVDILRSVPKDQWKYITLEETPGAMVPYSFEIFPRNFPFLKRTGFLPNPIRGMPSTVEKYMMDGQPTSARNSNAGDRIAARASTENKQILVMDSGIGCNVPAIHVARPQRKVDIILVVDCETKIFDKNDPSFFQTLKSTQAQMVDNNIKFPKIDVDKIAENHDQEYYVFEDGPDCPIVIWFTLYNKDFRKLPNTDRSDQYPPNAHDHEKFNDFDVTPDRKEYSTTSLQYSPRDVDRLRELMRHNIRENMDVVERKLAEKVAYLRSQM